MAEPGWFDITGGKLTTYRLMAEQAVDRIARYLGRATPPCRTACEPLLSGSETLGLSAVLPPPVAEPAVQHYCDHEWAVHLDDVMIRRTSWHHYEKDRLAIAERVAGWMARALVWDDPVKSTELDRYRRVAEAG